MNTFLEEYTSIDLNEELGAFSHDFNSPLENEELISQFDLVTDHGANEHAFNIAETYRTVHRLCKPCGLIVIVQQLWGGNGYYLFEKIEYLSYFLRNCPKRHNNQPTIPRLKGKGRGKDSKGLSGSYHRAQRFEVM